MLSRERHILNAIYKINSAGKSTDAKIEVALREMLSLGGIYVKFSQMLLLNESFAKAIPVRLRREIFDRVFVDERSTVATYLNKRELLLLQGKFSHIGTKPAYSGSFAVVFDAKLTDGTNVVIKILRPELAKSLGRDLRLLKVISKSIGLFNEEVGRGFSRSFREFQLTTRQETNYLAEIAQTKYLADLLRSDQRIKIPKIYDELSSRKVIVQEKFEGIWLTELLNLGLKGDVAEEFVRQRLGTSLREQLHYLGFRSLYSTLSGTATHGDPHPGNIVLMKDGGIGMVDVGIIAWPVDNRLGLLEYIKEQLLRNSGDIDTARLILSIVRFHASYLYRAVESLSQFYQRPLMDELYALLQVEASRFKQIDNGDLGKGQYSDMLSADVNKNNRFSLIPKIDNPVTQKAFITIWRTYDELGYSDLTFEVFEQVVRDIESNFRTLEWREKPMPADRALEIISEWLNRISEKDPELFAQLRQLFQAWPKKVNKPDTPLPN